MSSSTKLNALARVVNKVKGLPIPAAYQNKAVAFALGSQVKLFGTAGIDVTELTHSKVHLVLENKTKVQNHIGSVHACAMALLAESSTGFVVGMNIQDTCVPVIKSMKIDFVKRATGRMQAVATLSEEAIAKITSSEKGEVSVPVTVTDENGIEPIKVEMIWAWIPKIRK